MSAPKPFQEAAVNAALAAFDDLTGRRRFLVADEVGLGKTIVAKELARRMSEDGGKPLVIYYIANGHAVSHQNKGRVVGFLDDSQRKAATATPDRLSLIAIAKRPDNPVLIYALTPATSFPGARARLTGGRKEERAFLKVLLEQSYPAFARELDPDILRLSARGSWDWAVNDAETKFAASPSHLRQRFREALAAEFGEPVRAMLDLAVHGDADKKISRSSRPPSLAASDVPWRWRRFAISRPIWSFSMNFSATGRFSTRRTPIRFSRRFWNLKARLSRRRSCCSARRRIGF